MRPAKSVATHSQRVRLREEDGTGSDERNEDVVHLYADVRQRQVAEDHSVPGLLLGRGDTHFSRPDQLQLQSSQRKYTSLYISTYNIHSVCVLIYVYVCLCESVCLFVCLCDFKIVHMITRDEKLNYL